MSVISLDELHATLVAYRTGITGFDPGALAVGLWRLLVRCHHVGHQDIVTLSQQGAAVGELGLAVTVVLR
jgi:hypothetical protein